MPGQLAPELLGDYRVYLATHSRMAGITGVRPLNLALYIGSGDQVFRLACLANTTGTRSVLHHTCVVLELEPRACFMHTRQVLQHLSRM